MVPPDSNPDLSSQLFRMEEDTNNAYHSQVPSPPHPNDTSSDYGSHSDDEHDTDVDVIESPLEPETPPTFDGSFSPDEKFDVYDLELVFLPHKKAEINVRDRRVSSGRPTYKTEKTAHTHIFGKKNMDIVMKRNRIWDANKSEPIPIAKLTASGNSAREPYSEIFYAYDQGTRQLHVTATGETVISNTTQGGQFTLTPFCGTFDPQRSRLPRDSTAHHFFSLPVAWPVQELGKRHHAVPAPPPPNAPYTGGGFFIFDCHSQGSNDLVTTLYCTRNENRSNVRKGDIPIAELRLHTPILEPSKADVPAWRRLFRDRHATLHISRQGLDACLTGEDVSLVLPTSGPEKRYYLRQGQAQEIIIAAFTMAILSIEHDGLESKKWNWLVARELIERGNAPAMMKNGGTMNFSLEPTVLDDDPFARPSLVHHEQIHSYHATHYPNSPNSSIFSDGHRKRTMRRVATTDGVVRPQRSLDHVFPLSAKSSSTNFTSTSNASDMTHERVIYPSLTQSSPSPAVIDEMKMVPIMHGTVDVYRSSPLDELRQLQA